MKMFSKNHPVWAGIIGLVLLLIIVGAASGGSDKSTKSDKSATTPSAADTQDTTTPTCTNIGSPHKLEIGPEGRTRVYRVVAGSTCVSQKVLDTFAQKAGALPQTIQVGSHKLQLVPASAPAPAAPAPKPKSSKQRVRDALANVEASGYAGKLKIQSVEFGHADSSEAEAEVTVTTPEGGLSGASWDDLDNGAKAVFQNVYKDAGWKHASVIVFKGGLVSTETGKDLPDVNTGIYTMLGDQASEIDWSDGDALDYNIKWSNYRDFAHPALKH
jgi:hypothetical protein